MNVAFKIAVLVVLGLIVVTLAQGMRYLARDDGAREKTRLVKALTVRISLSVALFLLLMLGYYLGLIGR